MYNFNTEKSPGNPSLPIKIYPNETFQIRMYSKCKFRYVVYQKQHGEN